MVCQLEFDLGQLMYNVFLQQVVVCITHHKHIVLVIAQNFYFQFGYRIVIRTEQVLEAGQWQDVLYQIYFASIHAL